MDSTHSCFLWTLLHTTAQISDTLSEHQSKYNHQGKTTIMQTLHVGILPPAAIIHSNLQIKHLGKGSFLNVFCSLQTVPGLVLIICASGVNRVIPKLTKLPV